MQVSVQQVDLRWPSVGVIGPPKDHRILLTGLHLLLKIICSKDDEIICTKEEKKIKTEWNKNQKAGKEQQYDLFLFTQTVLMISFSISVIAVLSLLSWCLANATFLIFTNK